MATAQKRRGALHVKLLIAEIDLDAGAPPSAMAELIETLLERGGATEPVALRAPAKTAKR